MAKLIENAKPTNNYVLLRFYKVPKQGYDKSAGGILMPGGDDDNKDYEHKAIVEDVGPDVNLEERGFNIGDEVIFNEYDLKTFGEKEGVREGGSKTFGLVKDINIMCTIEVSR